MFFKPAARQSITTISWSQQKVKILVTNMFSPPDKLDASSSGEPAHQPPPDSASQRGGRPRTRPSAGGHRFATRPRGGISKNSTRPADQPPKYWRYQHDQNGELISRNPKKEAIEEEKQLAKSLAIASRFQGHTSESGSGSQKGKEKGRFLIRSYHLGE